MEPGNRRLSQLDSILRRRWFRLLAHGLVLLGLVGMLGASIFAEGYFTRGVATGENETPIPQTAVNPLGVNTFLHDEPDPQNVARTLDMIAEGGFTYVRQIFPWYDIEHAPGSFWDEQHQIDSWEKYDRIVTMAEERGLELIARLDKPPRWAREGEPNLDQFPDGPPHDYALFGTFVSTFVERYKGRIHYIQLWNEPNLAGEWGGQPIDPAAFTELLKIGYQAAKAVDPTITVLMPGLAPTDQTGPENLSDLLFLQGMYDAGAAGYFDIATVMVYGYGYSPSDRRVSYERNNFSRPIQTREIMVRNGDGDKPIWAAEYGWVSLPDDWDGHESPWGQPVSAEDQAKYLYQGYLRAQREWPWMGVMAIWHFRWPLPPDDPVDSPNPTRGFAIVEHDFSPRPAYTLLAQAADELNAAFTGAYRLPNPVVELDDDWEAGGTTDTPYLRPTAAGATGRIPFNGTRLDLTISNQGQGFAVSLDGQPVAGLPRDEQGRSIITPDLGSEEPSSTVTIASGLPDGPHQVAFTALAAGDDSATLLGFTVIRRTLGSWIYPWINAAIVILLVLNIASLRWSLKRTGSSAARSTKSELAVPVLSAAELREARGPRQPTTRGHRRH